MTPRWWAFALVASTVGTFAFDARADDPPRVIEIEFAPTGRAQLAIWIEDAAGRYLATLGLTEATAYRGIGNRPGASQMNSGFRWPYGRREGVLPIWAHRRAAAPGAKAFGRVIFQNRSSEGRASQTSRDQSRDFFYCLSFQQETTRRDALDAVSCASIFNSDKGRYATAADEAVSYGEPIEDEGGAAGRMRMLDTGSLYPPRRDIEVCAPSASCNDHPDAARFAADAVAVMPELDAITMATPPAESSVRLAFTVPDAWPDGDYVVHVEANVEGDYNASYDDARFPTPSTPPGMWDSWAINYGYPYRGQPSVLYRVPVRVSATDLVTASVAVPAGFGSVSGHGDDGGAVSPMDGTITDDPAGAPGSGADRLRGDGLGRRVVVTSLGAASCDGNVPPTAVTGFTASTHDDIKHAHEWATLSFVVPSDDLGVVAYDVRVSESPITDDASFLAALPAKGPSTDYEALVVPTDVRAGATVTLDMGGLLPERQYYVAMRAVDRCNARGPIAVAEVRTSEIHFTTVTPCFVATAAYGSPLEPRIGVLRGVRDRWLMSHAPGRALVRAYYEVGPSLAAILRGHEGLRAVVRGLLAPVIAAFDDDDRA